MVCRMVHDASASSLVMFIWLMFIIVCTTRLPSVSAVTMNSLGSSCSLSTLHLHDVSGESRMELMEAEETTHHYRVAHIRVFFDQMLQVRTNGESDATVIQSVRSHHSATVDQPSAWQQAFEVCCDGHCTKEHTQHAHSSVLPVHPHHIPPPSARGQTGNTLHPSSVLRLGWLDASALETQPNELAMLFVQRLSDEEWLAIQERQDAGEDTEMTCTIRSVAEEDQDHPSPVTLANVQGHAIEVQEMSVQCSSLPPAEDGLDHDHHEHQQHDELDIFVDVSSAAQADERAAKAVAMKKDQQAKNQPLPPASEMPEDEKTVMHIFYESQLARARDRGNASLELDGSDGYDAWFDPHFLHAEADIVPHLFIEEHPEHFLGQFYRITHHHEKGYFGVSDEEAQEHAGVIEVKVDERDRRTGKNSTRLIRLPFQHPDEHHFNVPSSLPSSVIHSRAEKDGTEKHHLFVLHHTFLDQTGEYNHPGVAGSLNDPWEEATKNAEQDFLFDALSSSHPFLEVSTTHSPLSTIHWPPSMQSLGSFLELSSELVTQEGTRESIGEHSLLLEIKQPTQETMDELLPLLKENLGWDEHGVSLIPGNSDPKTDGALHAEYFSDELECARLEAMEQLRDLLDKRERTITNLLRTESRIEKNKKRIERFRRQGKDKNGKRIKRKKRKNSKPKKLSKKQREARAAKWAARMEPKPKTTNSHFLKREAPGVPVAAGGKKNRGLMQIHKSSLTQTTSARAMIWQMLHAPIWGLVSTKAKPPEPKEGGWEGEQLNPFEKISPDPEEWIKERKLVPRNRIKPHGRISGPAGNGGKARRKFRPRKLKGRKHPGDGGGASHGGDGGAGTGDGGAGGDGAGGDGAGGGGGGAADGSGGGAAEPPSGTGDGGAGTGDGGAGAGDGGPAAGGEGGGGGGGGGGGSGLPPGILDCLPWLRGLDGKCPEVPPVPEVDAPDPDASGGDGGGDGGDEGGDGGGDGGGGGGGGGDQAGPGGRSKDDCKEEEKGPDGKCPGAGNGGRNVGGGAAGPPPGDGERKAHEVDKVINEYEWCDLEAPFENPTCPLPTFLMIFPNLLLKIAVCVLIPPVLDEFAEEYLTGHEPALKVWNALLLQTDEQLSLGGELLIGEDASAVGHLDSTHFDPLVAEATGSSAANTNHRKKQTPFDSSAAYSLMQDHIQKHYFSDFLTQKREAMSAAVPQEFHSMVARARGNIDPKILLKPDRRPIGAVFTEEFSSILAQHGLFSRSGQTPRAAGGEDGGGAELAGGHRGKALTPLIKKSLYNALVQPFINNLAKQVTYSVAGQVVPPVYDGVTDILRDELPDAIMHTVMHVTGNAVGMAVGTTVPESVERILPIVPIKMLTQSLTQMVTRSVGHALSSTLIHSVGSKPIRDYYCYYCMYFGYGCTQCHEHNTSSMRYAQYYNSFFSAYFGDYYSDHYSAQIYEIMKKDNSS